MGEHPGFLGGGEYAVDVYYDLIKRRMRKIDDELMREGESHDQRREQRRRKGFSVVSLAGYTNAGKSSLMRTLTGAEVLIEDRMFSTLSTTTKRLRETDLPILMTDTIGFLDDLPPFVIEAFKNTVTEIFQADLILLIVDASDDWNEIERKLSTSEQILFPEVEVDKVHLVLNKIDSIDEERRQWLVERIEERWRSTKLHLTSARTGEGTDQLLKDIIAMFSHQQRFHMVLPQTGESETFLTWLRSRATISFLEYGNDIKLSGTCDEADVKRITERALKLRGGRVSFEARDQVA